MPRPLRVIFAGTPDFAERHLDALINSRHEIVAVLSQPDRPSGRGKKRLPSPVKRRALEADLLVLQPPSLKDSDVQRSLTDLSADVMIVVAYGLILPQAVLDIPRFGCLNVHASLLPRWRGAAPIQRAVEAGDDESGVTIMHMDAGLDTGPMLAERRLRLNANETGGSLHDRLVDIGPMALIDVIDDLETHLAAAKTQDDRLATYAAKMTKVECDLDWSQPATSLARKIMAFNPVPVCFSNLDTIRVKIWEAVAIASTDSPKPPGTLLAANSDGLQVACGEGVLAIQKLQFPGGKPLTIAEALNGKAALIAPDKTFFNATTANAAAQA